MRNHLPILFLLLTNLFADNSVLVSAVGETQEKATKIALSKAVEQSVGVVVESETLVENYQIVKDKILTFSDGFVSNYKVVSAFKDGSHWFVQLDVSVAQDDLIKKIELIGLPVRKVSGKKIFAEALTKSNRDTDAVSIVSNTLQKGINDVLEFKVGEPRLIGTKDGVATIELLVGVRWKEAYWEKMEKVLEQTHSKKTVIDRTKRIDTWLMKRKNRDAYCPKGCVTISFQQNEGKMSDQSKWFTQNKGLLPRFIERSCEGIGAGVGSCQPTTYFFYQSGMDSFARKYRGGGNSKHTLSLPVVGFESSKGIEWIYGKIPSGELPDLWELSYMGGGHLHIDIKQPSNPWHYFFVSTTNYIEKLKDVEKIHIEFEERKN